MARFRQQTPAQGATDRASPMAEFLETNGLGGYSSSTLCGARTSPSQGLVVVAKEPPANRYVLLNGFDVRAAAGDGMEALPLCSHRMQAGRLEPDARDRLLCCDLKPWPILRYDLGAGREMELECIARHGAQQFVFCWQLTVSDVPVTLTIRPLLSGRPVDSTRLANPRLNLRPRLLSSRQFVWSFRAGAPDLTLLCDGIYQPDPKWITGFTYEDQTTEDLASPCEFTWLLQPREKAHIIASAQNEVFDDPHTHDFVAQLADKTRKAERTRRRLFRSEIDRAADQYVVSGERGATVLSGYPQGGERGADALIFVRGVALSPGRLHVASAILATWRTRLAAGLLPCALSEQRRVPSYGKPAASLWYIIAAYEYIRASYRHGRIIPPGERESLETSIETILQNLTDRRHRHLFVDDDSLLAEVDGVSGGTVRKRASTQALWIAALRIGDRLGSGRAAYSSRAGLYETARSEFIRAFWNSRQGCLYSEIFIPPGGSRQRPEAPDLDQILAVGGLPIICVEEDQASLMVEALEPCFPCRERLPFSSTIPWQFGPFIEAWFRVHHRDPEAKSLVLSNFIAPWQRQLRCGFRAFAPGSGCASGTEHALEDSSRFAAVETAELLRILHLPELISGSDPFDDALGGPLFYD